ncbi:PIG-L family deacetylase [Kutzneria albida]|uniref:GlcNAc-PI de-N-acetylase n=1 Tax=Kutzneria albida DSM 43870 TaxID=1449976 RepID=W5WAZ4_9PSEU|nr:PIG-L family deacetylase [Kutzneria albida]AHH98308.1 hypothetical protein KALB_4946 [Kutzneria albida DSM 43870]
MTTAIQFIAHQDDDLLFMNPDLWGDIFDGRTVWTVYLTAGEVPYRTGKTYGGMDYADMRIQGARAAYAEACGMPNSWTYQLKTWNGHQVATNQLNGTNLHLVFTFIHAAAAPEDPTGDLYRMLHDPAFIANPIDGRPGYTQAAFVAMLSALITDVAPDYIRTQNTLGHRDPAPNRDHVDHTAGAILAAMADRDASGNTRVRRDEYLGYAIRDDIAYPSEPSGLADFKTSMWNAYAPHDPELAPGAWLPVMGKQYRRPGGIYLPGSSWAAPTDF